MSTSTDGQICYGVKFDEYFEFPWNINHQDIEEWWNEKESLPVELVNYQSLDYPAYILAIPGLVRTASRGYPEKFEPIDLVADNKAVTKLILFIDKHLEIAMRKFEKDHEKKVEIVVRWWLSSYWG